LPATFPGFEPPERRRLFGALGITAKLERAAELKGLGADFIVESVADFLVPLASDAVFAANRARARAAPLRIRGCNSFMRDPSLICVGPKADHARVLSYSATAFARLQELGGEYIVFGSNTARRIPEGWSKAQADEQFIALLKAMAPLAKQHGITVAVEMQRSQECNYLNYIDEVVNVVAPVNHPNIRVLADLFHMRVMGDTPQKLAAAMRWVAIVELAEREQRTLPGVAGDDFRPSSKCSRARLSARRHRRRRLARTTAQCVCDRQARRRLTPCARPRLKMRTSLFSGASIDARCSSRHRRDGHGATRRSDPQIAP
jgi:sugar phosphate isomerase/epimerase